MLRLRAIEFNGFSALLSWFDSAAQRYGKQVLLSSLSCSVALSFKFPGTATSSRIFCLQAVDEDPSMQILSSPMPLLLICIIFVFFIILRSLVSLSAIFDGSLSN